MKHITMNANNTSMVVHGFWFLISKSSQESLLDFGLQLIDIASAYDGMLLIALFKHHSLILPCLHWRWAIPWSKLDVKHQRLSVKINCICWKGQQFSKKSDRIFTISKRFPKLLEVLRVFIHQNQIIYKAISASVLMVSMLRCGLLEIQRNLPEQTDMWRVNWETKTLWARVCDFLWYYCLNFDERLFFWYLKSIKMDFFSIWHNFY